jgi:hypothetical protein
MNMELAQWFDTQLRSTLDGFIWAIEQIPEERRYSIPPDPLGEWRAAQHVFQMLYYEGKLALPSMSQWLGAPTPAREEAREDLWYKPPAMEEMLDQFRAVRLEEIVLLPAFESSAWQELKVTTFWGEVSLAWLVGKTYQHTLDHTQDLLRFSLFWDRVVKRMSTDD